MLNDFILNTFFNDLSHFGEVKEEGDLFTDALNYFDSVRGNNDLTKHFETSALKRLDVKSKKDEQGVHYSLVIPGFKKDEIKIEIDGRLLKITASKEEKKDAEDNKNDLRVFYSKYNHNILLNDNVDITKIDAKLEDGILYIDIPEKEAETFKIEIK